MKKHTTLLLSSLVLMFMLTACTPYDTKEASPMATYKQLDQSSAKEDLDTNEDILLVDVRTPEEYAEKRIPNSLLLPDYDLVKLASEQLPDKDALIYLYCRTGRRSSAAANDLIDMGYTQVYDIGGIVDWKYETLSD